MNSVLATILSYLLIYKYFALFVVMLAAAIALPLPTDTMMVAIGAFSYQGYFSFWISLSVALVANVLGDVIDYWIVRKYGHVVLRERYIKKYSFFTRLEDFFHHHVRLTIFVTRFIGIVSPLTNFLSGFVKIPFSLFLTYDFLGNLIDNLMLLSIGYFIGNNWELIYGKISIVGTIVAFGVIAYIYYKIYKSKS